MIYGSKHGKILIFAHFYCNFTTMVATEVKLWSLTSLDHFWQDPWDTLSEVAFWGNAQSLQKYCPGVLYPLKCTPSISVFAVSCSNNMTYIVWSSRSNKHIQVWNHFKIKKSMFAFFSIIKFGSNQQNSCVCFPCIWCCTRDQTKKKLAGQILLFSCNLRTSCCNS